MDSMPLFLPLQAAKSLSPDGERSMHPLALKTAQRIQDKITTL